MNAKIFGIYIFVSVLLFGAGAWAGFSFNQSKDIDLQKRFRQVESDLQSVSSNKLELEQSVNRLTGQLENAQRQLDGFKLKLSNSQNLSEFVLGGITNAQEQCIGIGNQLDQFGAILSNIQNYSRPEDQK